MRVLVVEDSVRLLQSLATGLRRAGFAVDVAPDGEEGLFLAESSVYDVIVLDLMLPKVDGMTILRKLRKKGIDTHILLLTARDTVEDRVLGLRTGADDYLVKPFAFDELLARVQGLARRSYGVKKPLLVIGDLEIDTTARVARFAGKPVALTPREFALLEFLSLRKGEVVSRQEIEEHIYDDRTEPMSNVVDATICAIRKKIASVGRRSLIRTRRGMGYVLEPPP